MSLRSIITAAILLACGAAAATAGPPWIAVELPANPHHASTRDAAFLVRAYHHSTSINVPVQGTAHGLVDGRRVSMALDIRPTNTPGVFAVYSALPKKGAWVLAVTLTQSEDATATALVSVDARGRVVAVAVPSNRTRDGWSVPRPVTRADIDAALRDATIATAQGPRGERYAALLALPLLLAGGFVARRRSRR